MMLSLWALWALSITTTSTTASRADPNHDYLLMKRLDALERAIFQQQEDFEHEREQWQEDKQSVMGRLHAVQKNVHKLQAENQELKKEMKTLQDSEPLTQPATKEGGSVKAEVVVLQHRLDTLSKKQQSLEDMVTKCEKKTKQDADVSGECSGKDDPMTKKIKNADASTGKKDPTPAQKLAEERSGKPKQTDEDVSSLESSTGQHQPSNLAARSDDLGSLEMVVNHATQKLTQIEADIQALKNVGHDQGSSFVHWGSSTCPGSSDLVYSGVVGGSFYTDNGAAANTLCLSLSPVLHHPALGASYTHIYGGEYETHDSHHNKDPLCAVCRAHESASVVIPGTDVCSLGWTKQYSGHLMAGLYTHHAATEFICVDSKMEGGAGSVANANGHLLFYTDTVCGSLPCPPYSNGKVMTCVVCSK